MYILYIVPYYTVNLQYFCSKCARSFPSQGIFIFWGGGGGYFKANIYSPPEVKTTKKERNKKGKEFLFFSMPP